MTWSGRAFSRGWDKLAAASPSCCSSSAHCEQSIQGRLIVARPATREIFHHLILFYFLKKTESEATKEDPRRRRRRRLRRARRSRAREAHLVQRGSYGDLALVLRRRVVPAALRVRERGVGASGPAPLGGRGSRGGLGLRHRPRPAPAPREDLQVRGRGARALAPPVPRPHEPAYVAQNGGHLQLLGLRRILHGRAPRRGVCVRWLRNRAAAAAAARCGRAGGRASGLLPGLPSAPRPCGLIGAGERRGATWRRGRGDWVAAGRMTRRALPTGTDSRRVVLLLVAGARGGHAASSFPFPSPLLSSTVRARFPFSPYSGSRVQCGGLELEAPAPGFGGLFLLFSLLPCSRLALDLSGAKAAFPAAMRFFTRHILLHLIRYFNLLALFKLFAFIYVFLHYDLGTIVHVPIYLVWGPIWRFSPRGVWLP